MNETAIIVIGALNTDIIASELATFPRPNDPVYGGKLVIGPGGKSGNIASMAGKLSSQNAVAIISRTVKDPYGLWQKPIDGLQSAGVNTDFVKIMSGSETSEMPSVALVAVDKSGNNMCFILPGISEQFSEADVDAATPLFEAASKNHGIFALSLECPAATARHAIKKAVEMGIRVALDPGGVVEGADITDLLGEKPYIFKPNEFEAQAVTGIKITDMESAKQAAVKLKALGAQNVLITHGEKGAYLFGEDEEAHIPAPALDAGPIRDATGCGDQTMATLCVFLKAGKSLSEASEAAILAGTLQFHKLGIQPVSKEEIEARL